LIRLPVTSPPGVVASRTPGGGRILTMLRRVSIIWVSALALLLSGCVKRHGPQNMVVFVPAPPPAAHSATELPTSNSDVMVIEEPAPPPQTEAEDEEVPQPQTPEPTLHRRTHHLPRPEATTETDEHPPPQDDAETPSADVPVLAPRKSTSEETELRRQFLSLDQDIRQRLAKLGGAQLSANNQKTLDDARTFFAQATSAMASGDLPRAINLARKAGLLLAALE
jgi:hypothetical protein